MITSLQNHPFCRFSTQITRQAEDALVVLRGRHHLNVNLVLFCYWFAANNQGLISKTQMKRLMTAIYSWNQKIVVPLYVLCAQLQKFISTNLWSLEDSAYEDAKNTLVTAEQIEQLLLAEALPKKVRRNRVSLFQMATHAFINIFHYCQSIYVSLDEVDYKYLSLITASAFPDMDPNKMGSFVRNILTERHKKQPVQKNLPLHDLKWTAHLCS